jgi:magnesium-transporting ATPase (P-type)
MSTIQFFQKLLFLVILVNYVIELLYTLGRLVGVGLWLPPINTSTTEGLVSFELYVFELVLVTQFFLIWLISWRKRWVFHVKRGWQIGTVVGLAIAIAIFTVLVFSWNAGWPGMLERRLFAYESWVLITILSIFVQVSFINVPETIVKNT